MENNLQISNLSKHYKDFSLKNISFDLPCGAIMGLIGENGAGKTTTIKAILNMIKIDGGQILIFGKDHIAGEQKIKEQVGIVLDKGFFYEEINPEEICLIMLKTVKAFDKAKFYEYLKLFELPSKPIKSFSRGMLVKLKIAIALSRPARLLILDEPTSGLDPVVRTEILDLLQEFVQDEEKSILISSHITSDLEQIADYISYINNGELVFCQNKDSLLEQYGILRCDQSELSLIDKSLIVGTRKSQFNIEALIKNKAAIKRAYPELTVDKATIDEIMLYHVRRDK